MFYFHTVCFNKYLIHSCLVWSHSLLEQIVNIMAFRYVIDFNFAMHSMNILTSAAMLNLNHGEMFGFLIGLCFQMTRAWCALKTLDSDAFNVCHVFRDHIFSHKRNIILTPFLSWVTTVQIVNFLLTNTNYQCRSSVARHIAFPTVKNTLFHAR